MATLFKILFWLFALLYLTGIVAFAALLLGATGYFALVQFVLIPIGMPWNLLAESVGPVVIFGFHLAFLGAMFGPAINLLILWLLMRWARRAR
jgi:hypothetical protein